MTDEADERERAEAEALARALDDGAGTAAPPEDALAAAALLRYSGRRGELADDRGDAVLQGLLPQVEAAARRRARVRVLATSGGVLAAAAALLLFITRAPSDPHAGVHSAPTPGVRAASTSLPAPPAALLSAQAGAAKAGDGSARARFEAEMRAYRGALLGALERAYPPRVGLLSGRGRR